MKFPEVTFTLRLTKDPVASKNGGVQWKGQTVTGHTLSVFNDDDPVEARQTYESGDIIRVDAKQPSFSDFNGESQVNVNSARISPAEEHLQHIVCTAIGTNLEVSELSETGAINAQMTVSARRKFRNEGNVDEWRNVLVQMFLDATGDAAKELIHFAEAGYVCVEGILDLEPVCMPSEDREDIEDMFPNVHVLKVYSASVKTGTDWLKRKPLTSSSSAVAPSAPAKKKKKPEGGGGGGPNDDIPFAPHL